MCDQTTLLRRLVQVCIVIAPCFLSTSVVAQDAQPRLIASFSEADPEAQLQETAIAVGVGRVLSVFHVRDSSTIQIGYSFATLGGGGWTWSEEGIIDNVLNDDRVISRFSDPSVA